MSKNQLNYKPTERLIRLDEVLAYLPVSRSTWWCGVKTGRFPSASETRPAHALLALGRHSRPRRTRRWRLIRTLNNSNFRVGVHYKRVFYFGGLRVNV